MKNIQLSKRLSAVASLVSRGARVCDVGTDHGFVPIYLINSNTAQHVIAMDVGEGPLSRAKEHIAEYGYEDFIETRLSDGMEKLSAGEADTLICAGMGGLLMKKILGRGNPAKLGLKHMILQPQSDLRAFREYLREAGFFIIDEKEIFEEGKYYVAMLTEVSEEKKLPEAYEKAAEVIMKSGDYSIEDAVRICDKFGPCLILEKNADLKKYLEHELEIAESILLKLSENAHPDRERDIIIKKNDITTALNLL